MIEYLRIKTKKRSDKMAKKQKWTVTSDTETHTVEYTPRTLFSRAKIKIDENTYPLYSARLFGESQEAFKLGDEMAVISVAKNRRASLTVSGEIIPSDE